MRSRASVSPGTKARTTTAASRSTPASTSARKPLPATTQCRVVDLPVVDVAAVVYTGAMQDIESAYERLIGWIDDSDYGLAGRSRELYLEFHEDDPDRNVTELQMPIARN